MSPEISVARSGEKMTIESTPTTASSSAESGSRRLARRA